MCFRLFVVYEIWIFNRFKIYLDIVVVSLFAFVANLFVGAIHVSCFIVLLSALSEFALCVVLVSSF